MILWRLQEGAYLLCGRFCTTEEFCRYVTTDGPYQCVGLVPIVVGVAAEGGTGFDQADGL